MNKPEDDKPLAPDDMCFEGLSGMVRDAHCVKLGIHTDNEQEEEDKEVPPFDPEFKYTDEDGDKETYLILLVHGIGSDLQWQIYNANEFETCMKLIHDKKKFVSKYKYA